MKCWRLFSLGSFMALGVCLAVADYYVRPDGNEGGAGTSWATAVATPSNAVAKAGDGDTIWVSNGAYAVEVEIAIEKAITLRSVNGWADTILYRPVSSTNRILVISNALAVVDGFSITNGFLNGNNLQGAGVRLYAGGLQNCLIQSNRIYTAGPGQPVFGGGVGLSGGWMSNCVIRGNAALTLNGYGGRPLGGGVYMTGGEVLACTVVDNIAEGALTPTYGGIGGGYGGGIHMTGGSVINSVVARNWAPEEGGGIYLSGASSRVLHCTLALNRVRQSDSGGLFQSAGVASNVIVYYNLRTCDDFHVNIRKTGGTLASACAWPLPGGTGHIDAEPDFMDLAAGDFALAPGSACIDAAPLLADVATDRDGSPRPRDGDAVPGNLADLGAYEAAPLTGGLFRCNFKTPTNQAVDALSAILTAVVAGPMTNGLYFWWDTDGDELTDDQGPALAVKAVDYPAGIFSPGLTVTNGVGETASIRKTDYIRVFPDSVYVATNGTGVFPYDTWGKATTNLREAVAAAADGGTVWVTNGAYTIASVPPVVLAKGVTVRSMTGPTNTLFRGGRRFEVLHSNAVVEGITLTLSGGILLTAGRVAECIITNNANNRNISVRPAYGNYGVTDGGGVYMSGGILERSVIASNIAYNTANGGDRGGGGGGASICRAAR